MTSIIDKDQRTGVTTEQNNLPFVADVKPLSYQRFFYAVLFFVFFLAFNLPLTQRQIKPSGISVPSMI